jgi:hypothetical protein
MVVFLKLLIVVAVVGILRSSETFRRKSREFDEAALVSLERMVRATEESGFAPETIPLFIALTTIVVIAMMMSSGLFGH